MAHHNLIALFVILERSIDVVIQVIARQDDDYARPLTFATGNRDRAAALLHQELDNRQSDAESGRSCGRGPIEQFQHARRLITRYA